MSYIDCRQCGCNCNQCGQPLNESNKTVIVPVSGESAYETWKAYNPDSTLTEAEWLEQVVKTNLNYEEFEI